jgi:hypothetical protein
MSRHVSVIVSLACNYLATACQIVCGLAIVPIAIRHLGEAGYGTWLGLTALGAVIGFADMGVSGTPTRQQPVWPCILNRCVPNHDKLTAVPHSSSFSSTAFCRLAG